MNQQKQAAQTLEESQHLYFSLQKYPWVYPIIMVVLSLADFGILLLYYRLQYLQGRNVLPQLLAVHVVIFVVVVIFRRSSSPQTREISPLMFLLLPGVGSLLYSLSYLTLFLVGSKFKKKEIRHSYADEVVTYEKSVSVDFSQISRLMDMAGAFSYSDSLNKKEMIVDLLSGDISANSNLLKKGLGDSDPEVVHYTASTLNYLEERYEKAIQKARALCVEELTRERLMNVATLYSKYMGSGLLEGDILPIYRKSYIDVLELIRKEFGEDAEILQLLTEAYVSDGQLEEADAMVLRAVELFPENITLKFIRMKFYNTVGRLDDIVRVAEEVLAMPDELTKEQQAILDFWLSEDMGR